MNTRSSGRQSGRCLGREQRRKLALLRRTKGMADRGDVYTFEVLGRVLTSDRPVSPIGEFHRALAQAAVEAILEGLEGFSVEGVKACSATVWASCGLLCPFGWRMTGGGCGGDRCCDG